MVGAVLLLMPPASMSAASDNAETLQRKVRLIEAENRALRSQIQSLRKEISQLKAGPAAATRPSSRPATSRPDSTAYIAGPAIRGDGKIGLLRAFFGPTTRRVFGGERERVGLIVVLEITNRSDERKMWYRHFDGARLADNLGNSYDRWNHDNPKPLIPCSPGQSSILFPGDKEINVLVFDSRLVPKAKTLILNLGRLAFDPFDPKQPTKAVEWTIRIDRLGKAPDASKELPPLNRPSKTQPRSGRPAGPGVGLRLPRPGPHLPAGRQAGRAVRVAFFD